MWHSLNIPPLLVAVPCVEGAGLSAPQCCFLLLGVIFSGSALGGKSSLYFSPWVLTEKLQLRLELLQGVAKACS